MAIQQFHEKVSSFFNDVQERLGPDMNCRSGCSRCCYVDLSVFTVEADLIATWFEKLPEETQALLKLEWEKPIGMMESFAGEMTQACVFLKDEKCTIYEVRPTICSTQGLPLLFNGNEVDACPLNFVESEIELSDCLDLERTNKILSAIAGKDSHRVYLRDLLTRLVEK